MCRTIHPAKACLVLLTFFSSSASIAASCDRHAPPWWQPEGMTNTAIFPIATQSRGFLFGDPNFATDLMRVTNTPIDYPSSLFLRIDYSRRQAFSPDGTKLMAYGPSPGYWHLYDFNLDYGPSSGYGTAQYVKQLNFLSGDAEPQWHATDSNRFYYLPNQGGTTLLEYNVSADTSAVVANLTTGLPPWAATAAHIWTKSEGSPSADSRYWGFMVENSSFNTLGFMTWDLQSNSLIAARQLPAGEWRPDHVSMSPSGRWIVISDDNSGSASGGTWAWSRDFTTKKKLHIKSEHSDLSYAVNGTSDVYTSIDYQVTGNVFFVDIDACPSYPAATNPSLVPLCPRTAMFSTYGGGTTTALHISGKGYDRPGWVLISTYKTAPTCTFQMPWYGNKMFIMELAANPRIYEIAHLRGFSPSSPSCNKFGEGVNQEPSIQTDYWFEPHATTDRRMRTFAFNSAWTNDMNESDLNIYVARPAAAAPIDNCF